jgi:hypothetical protein
MSRPVRASRTASTRPRPLLPAYRGPMATRPVATLPERLRHYGRGASTAKRRLIGGDSQSLSLLRQRERATAGCDSVWDIRRSIDAQASELGLRLDRTKWTAKARRREIMDESPSPAKNRLPRRFRVFAPSRFRNYPMLMLESRSIDVNHRSYGARFSPSHRTVQLPSSGKPGALRFGAPSQPAHIIAAA